MAYVVQHFSGGNRGQWFTLRAFDTIDAARAFLGANTRNHRIVSVNQKTGKRTVIKES